MKTTSTTSSTTTISALIAIAQAMELDTRYGYIGIRTQEVPFAAGPMSHCSRVWDDGEDTGIELPGVCVTSINARVFPQYFGAHVAIVCGNIAEYGEDVGELIIADPVVEYIAA